MRNYVEDFTKHLEEAKAIGSKIVFNEAKYQFSNILISGLGGSGIGGTIISQQLAGELKIPVNVNKDYGIPAFVDSKTLFIACSYSGNTEETVEAVEMAEQRNAEIAIITSGGKLLEIAKTKGYNYILMPSGFPPRAAFGFSFPQLYFMLEKYGLIDASFISAINNSIQLIDKNEESIKKEAAEITEKLFGKIPVIYAVADSEGVAVRFRQQINENSKMLCWHHAIPEMNHNELVGWAGGNQELAVVIFRNENDYQRNQTRIEINKEIFLKYTSNITEIYSKGNSILERALYHVHLGDWISVLLAEKKQIDPVEVNVIDFLKGSLANS
mgnify:CR=1 FL=1